MQSWKKRVPIVRQFAARHEILEIEFRLDLRTDRSSWEAATFLLDTGSQFTTVSIASAERLSIPYSTTRPVMIDTRWTTCRAVSQVARWQAPNHWEMSGECGSEIPVAPSGPASMPR